MDRATQVPVVHSVAFGYPDFDEWYDVATGKAQGHIYGRTPIRRCRCWRRRCDFWRAPKRRHPHPREWPQSPIHCTRYCGRDSGLSQ